MPDFLDWQDAADFFDSAEHDLTDLTSQVAGFPQLHDFSDLILTEAHDSSEPSDDSEEHDKLDSDSLSNPEQWSLHEFDLG